MRSREYKEAVNEGWCKNPTGLFINSCKSGEKPKNTVDAGIKDWFESLRRERIVIAMSGSFVYTVDGEAVSFRVRLATNPHNKRIEWAVRFWCVCPKIGYDLIAFQKRLPKKH